VGESKLVSCDVTPSILRGCRHFGGIWCLHLKGYHLPWRLRQQSTRNVGIHVLHQITWRQPRS